MKHALQGLLIFLAGLTIYSCRSSKIYYGPDARKWQEQQLPDSATLAYTVYLLGDAGAPKPGEPTFKLLKSQLDRDPNSTLVVLGDNLYHNGLSEEGATGRDIQEQRLDDQVNLAADYQGNVFFVPGNHDWDYMGPKGLEKIRRQEQYIEQKLNRGNTFVPDNGCPGPFTVSLHNDVVFIGFDSQWWLHRHEKPYGPTSGCQATNETEMLQQIEQILEENKGKHVVVSAHHPFFSNSNHGGYYSVMDHLFPLRLIRDGLYVPLPVIGSLYPFFRKYGGVDQDIPHFRYQQLINELTRIFVRYDNIIYTAGHDHNLQLHRTEKFVHIISGSGCKSNHTERGNNATFVHNEKGFVKLLYYTNGDAWTEFWTPKGDGTQGQVNYREKLYNRKAPDVETICPETLVQKTHATRTPSPNKLDLHPLSGLLLRSHYKQEWNTPVQVPLLDLGTTSHSLAPFGVKENQDKYLLRLRNADGFEYSFRPLLRNSLLTVPTRYRHASSIEQLRETWLPSQHPYAPLVVRHLEKAAGVLTPFPQLYLLPDLNCLGAYKEQFANKMGYLEPDAEDYHSKELAPIASPPVLSYNSLVLELERNHQHQVNARAFAKARLLDMLVGDWDRHEAQYTWAQQQQKGKTVYLPIPEDRDNAFFYFNGLLPWLANRGWGVRELQHFSHKIDNLKGLNSAARNLDRRLLSSLTPADWVAIADSLQQALTDEVLDSAVHQMPAEVFSYHGGEIAAKLKARRMQLQEVAQRYGKLLAHYVDVYGSEQEERFEVERKPDGTTHVRMYTAGTKADTLLYSRTFSPSETKEVRLYGLGGKDQFHISGRRPTRKDILIRIIGHRGHGRYQYTYSGDTLAVPHTELYTIHNASTDELVEDNTTETEADFTSGDLINSPASDRFFYTHVGPSMSLLYNQADGLVAGVGVQYRSYKFRSNPYGSRHTLLYQRALSTGMSRLFYQSELKNFAYDLDMVNTAWAYTPYYSMRFSGYGNNPATAAAPESPQQVEFRNIHLSSALQKPFGSFFAIGAGPLYEYYHLSQRRNSWVSNYLPEQDKRLFGHKNYFGASAFFRTDVKDNKYNPMRGLVINLEANWLMGLNSGIGRYSRYKYEVRYYMSPTLPFQLTFAGRLGGSVNTGEFSFYQGSMLGGGVLPDFSQNLRGYYRSRFIGDRSLYANLEMRVSLFNYRLYLFPGKVGLLGLYDSGRVWTRVNHTGGWHSAYGGGAWISLFNRIVLSGTVAHSPQGSFVNIQHGFYF
ncbi:metallophosphoesterase [Pontibacter sp. 13R65]|uniref:metallophosphoesterase n=1 Tax=Pontibacter sp. 13R65 TaxID=3127458 RepID=UPI00301E5E6C